MVKVKPNSSDSSDIRKESFKYNGKVHHHLIRTIKTIKTSKIGDNGLWIVYPKAVKVDEVAIYLDKGLPQKKNPHHHPYVPIIKTLGRTQLLKVIKGFKNPSIPKSKEVIENVHYGN